MLKFFINNLGGLNLTLFFFTKKKAVEVVLGVVLGDEFQHPQQQVPTEEW